MKLFIEISNIVIFLVGIVAVFAIGIVAITTAMECIVEMWNERRTTKFKQSLSYHLYSLKDWCGHEYPIVKDLADHLLEYTNGICSDEISRLRDALRKKYPTEKNNE